MFNRLAAYLLIFALVLSLSACGTLQYYGQAAQGQLSLMLKRQSIEKLINDDQPALNLSPEQQSHNTEKQRKLKRVMDIRAFAQQQLGLPVGNAYATYVDTGKNYVVWNVFAAEEFSVEPKQWCYPIIGCASYRGYFNQNAAQQYAAKLTDQSFETHVSGVSAYSTLGWFNDPVLNTFLNYSELDLAALLFHELAHRVVYIAGDTTFNESFATAVEIYGVKQWLQFQNAHLIPSELAKDQQLQQFMQRIEAKAAFVKLVSEARAQLNDLYTASNQNDIQQLRQEKNSHFNVLKQQVYQFADQYYPAQNQQQSAANNHYKQWASNLNNAKLIPVNSYYQWVEAVTAKLDQHLKQHSCSNMHSNNSQLSSDNCQQALKDFYQSVKQLKKLDAESRNTLLEQWQS